MPIQQTRESIETELSSDQVQCLKRRMKETLREIEDIELTLSRVEEWRGLPSSRSAPVIDRMASLGIGKSLIKYVDEMLASVPG